MTRRIDFTPRARSQFLAAVEHIHVDRPSAARAFRARSADALKRLIRFPESGRAIPEFSEVGFREVLVGRYRFFYRLQGDVVWVVGVWHDAQIPDDPA
ncbi:MAG: type II toxin-antitoxin system RelE/ParE family toxin [Actinobacteria bacterium]|nr:type II toxin-antitoxin system RelE/ParE family toxin [Actinomycetota bacterium]MCL5887451.1 type II toxin-antitoxin system RelE/ParE family toxin [Actinomycetota bacterium]